MADLKSKAPAIVPKPQPTTVAVVAPPQEYRARYLDDIAPSNIVGRMFKFSKEGQFVTSDDGQPIPDNAEFVALCDQVLVGWIKFNGDDNPPDREMGLLYDPAFRMAARESLGDLDESSWEVGLSGERQDPWIHQICLVLQRTDTAELFTFVTSSKTGRRAVGNLLRHYDRMRRTHADYLPRVRLSSGGFTHKDSRIGWVSTPVFVVVGRSPRDGIATPETTTTEAYLNDEIPFP